MDLSNSIIISAELPGLTKMENARRSSDLLNDILDIVVFDGTVIPCYGVYKGVPEQSYLVHTENLLVMLNVAYLGTKYEQECVLIIAEDNEAEIIHCPPADNESHYTLEFHTDEPEGDYTEILGEYFTLVPVTGH